MIFLMMAAHDTTTSALTSMTYALARHPDWQQRLHPRGRGRWEWNTWDMKTWTGWNRSNGS